MYSIEMKYSPSTAPSSKMWTMFGWLRRADSFASSTNILMKDVSSDRCGRIRLTTNTRSKPAGPWMRPLYTSAMPPRPMRSNSVYLPNYFGSESCVATAKTLGRPIGAGPPAALGFGALYDVAWDAGELCSPCTIAGGLGKPSPAPEHGDPGDTTA